MFFGILCDLSLIDAKRRVSSQSNKLGGFCIPGTCTSLNSNCKRVGGNTFRCVCKEQFIAVNKTHCVRVINSTIDSTCVSCNERKGICLDENSDGYMDTCFCQPNNDLCHGRASTPSIQETEPVKNNHFDSPSVTPIDTDHRSVRSGELKLGLYNVNQQHFVENGGSVSIDDRLSIELEYRGVKDNIGRRQIIAENCSLASSVSDNESKLEKISLLTNRCPSLDSNLTIRFQRLDSDHIKSTHFQMPKFETTSIVYLRCTIAICYGRTENCQERLCPETRRPSLVNRSAMNPSIITTTDSAPFDYVDEGGASVIALRRRKRELLDDDQTKKKLARILSDLTSSMDQISASSSNDLIEDNNPNHYEIRQVQQQIKIEIPLTQSASKHKSHGVYGRTSWNSQGAIERSTVIATISIIFMIGVSISLFAIYRTCYTDYVQRVYGSSSLVGFGQGESIYGGLRGTAQVCRYDMGRRSEQRFDESFFVTNVEPLGAYRRQY